jgi:hypothetical protein
MSTLDLDCSSNDVSHADDPMNAAARMNVVEKPKKKDVNPEIAEPARLAIPTSALYTPKD